MFFWAKWLLLLSEARDKCCATSAVHSDCTVINKEPWTAMQRKEEVELFLNRKVLPSFSKSWTEWLRDLHTTYSFLHERLTVTVTTRDGKTKILI